MRILLTGASGHLAMCLARELERQSLPAVAWGGPRSHPGATGRPVDLADRGAVRAAFRAAAPTLVIHAAAVASVADCYRDADRARRVNVDGSALLAALAGEAGARLLYVSTDLVFDGARGGYREEDPPAPLSVYGRSKAAAEAAVLESPCHAVARVSLLFGPGAPGRASFFDQQVAALRECRPVTLFEDEWRTPLSLRTAAEALVAVARSDVTGILHVGGPERLSRLEMGRRLAAYLDCDPAVLVPARRASAPAPEPRARDVSLDSSRWRQLFPHVPWPGWDEALRQLGDRTL